jgi:hypothetical protein
LVKEAENFKNLLDSFEKICILEGTTFHTLVSLFLSRKLSEGAHKEEVIDYFKQIIRMAKASVKIDEAIEISEIDLKNILLWCLSRKISYLDFQYLLNTLEDDDLKNSFPTKKTLSQIRQILCSNVTLLFSIGGIKIEKPQKRTNDRNREIIYKQKLFALKNNIYEALKEAPQLLNEPVTDFSNSHQEDNVDEEAHCIITDKESIQINKLKSIQKGVTIKDINKFAKVTYHNEERKKVSFSKDDDGAKIGNFSQCIVLQLLTLYFSNI